jgi:23S rRNA pseudouridine1911/1915/1917 synthase
MKLTGQLLREAGEDASLYLIHRLDRVVGGLLVFARDKATAALLSSAVAERKMTKEYYAIVPGQPSGGVMEDYLYKDATLGKAFVTDRKRAGVKEARLEYKCCRTVSTDKGEISLVRVRLDTGRFHQIRCQFASRKMPLLGDKKYGSRDFVAKAPALFAAHLSFDFNGKLVEASALPDLSKYPWSLFDEEDYT